MVHFSIREKKKTKSSIQERSQTPLSCNPSPWRPRKKDLSYCECCHQPFNNLEEVEIFHNYFCWHITNVFFFFCLFVFVCPCLALLTSVTCGLCCPLQHLQSDQHRAFVLDLSNYTAVDQLVAEMLPGFNPDPHQQSDETLNQ